MLDLAKKYNIKFNRSKIQFKQNSVRFLGQMISKEGVRPNENYTRAIRDMPIPEKKKELLRFLGMVKYVGKFIPNLSKITACLRNLTRLDVEWKWSDQHQRTMNQLKHLLTQALVLSFLDPSKEVEIETDRMV